MSFTVSNLSNVGIVSSHQVTSGASDKAVTGGAIAKETASDSCQNGRILRNQGNLRISNSTILNAPSSGYSTRPRGFVSSGNLTISKATVSDSFTPGANSYRPDISKGLENRAFTTSSTLSDCSTSVFNPKRKDVRIPADTFSLQRSIVSGNTDYGIQINVLNELNLEDSIATVKTGADIFESLVANTRLLKTLYKHSRIPVN